MYKFNVRFVMSIFISIGSMLYLAIIYPLNITFAFLALSDMNISEKSFE